MGIYSGEDQALLNTSTGECIVEMSADIENMETLSDSSDYLEPFELGLQKHLQGDYLADEAFEKVQNVRCPNKN
jgi:hypothetical protein